MKIEGRRKLLANMKKMAPVARAEFRKALEQNAQEMTALARRFAPEDSGALKKSIAYTFGDYQPANANVRGVAGGGRGDKDLAVVIHAGDADAFYASMVEFGHATASAKPYFFPSYRLMRKRARSRLARANRKAVQAVTGNTR